MALNKLKAQPGIDEEIIELLVRFDKSDRIHRLETVVHGIPILHLPVNFLSISLQELVEAVGRHFLNNGAEGACNSLLVLKSSLALSLILD